MKRVSALGLAALALTGCMETRPAIPSAALIAAPPTWRGGANGPELDDASWWRLFGDPVLDALEVRALSRNTDVGLWAARVEEARALVRSARAATRPEIDVSSGGSYSKTVTLGIPVTTLGGQSEATIAWDADLFGRLAKADQAARASLLATDEARDAVLLSVARDTAETYFRLLGADARLAITTRTLATREASAKLAHRLAAAGYASRLDELQAQAEYKSTAALIPQARLAVTQLEDALSVLAGDPPGTIKRAGRGLDAVRPPSIPSGLPSSLLRRRPDVLAAENRIVAADHSLDSARAAMLPDLTIGGSAGRLYATALPNPFTIFDIGGSVLAPLFDSGRRRAAADAAAARRDQAAFTYRDTVLTAFREAEDQFAAVGRAGEQSTLLAAQVEVEAAAQTVAGKRYAAGYTAQLETLDTQRQLLSSQLNLVDARTSQLVGTVALFAALGGGWTAPASPGAELLRSRSGLRPDGGRTPGNDTGRGQRPDQLRHSM